MMRRLMTVVGVAALALTPLAAARAADQAATTSAPSRPAKARHMTAEVKSVDAAAKRLTVKRSTGREVTLTVAPEAAAALADLKPGERVRITYLRSGGQLTAQAISPVAHAATR